MTIQNGSGLTTGLNYVDGTRASHGFRFTFDHAWSGIPVDTRELPITDICGMAEQPTLEREGFETLSLGIDPVDPRDREAMEQTWRPAVVQAVQRRTGADAVASWALGSRFSERQADAPRSDVSNPARRVHGDFAPSEFGEEVRHGLTVDAIAEVSEGRKPVRWWGMNVWQPVSRPPYDTTLALCDARTVAPEDLVVGRGSVASMPEIEIDLPVFAHSPRHRWYYWSHMEPDQAMVFSGLDSSMPGHWRLVPHSAFDNAQAPCDAPPRNSVEMRVMALWFA